MYCSERSGSMNYLMPWQAGAQTAASLQSLVVSPQAELRYVSQGDLERNGLDTNFKSTCSEQQAHSPCTSPRPAFFWNKVFTTRGHIQHTTPGNSTSLVMPEKVPFAKFLNFWNFISYCHMTVAPSPRDVKTWVQRESQKRSECWSTSATKK